MALFEGKTPAERNKMIAAIALPLITLIFIVRMFSGPSGPTRTTPAPTPKPKATRSPGPQTVGEQPDLSPDINVLTPVGYEPTAYSGESTGRNIFAFYVRPVTAQTGPAAAQTPLPTPTPPPPLLLASLTPQSVFARTAGFTLQVAGDKFGPEARIYIDGQELPTQYRSMQQLTANVPAAIIANAGQRTVAVRTPDGKLYSNDAQLNVMQPPAPTYTFIGFLKRARSNTAVVKDQKGELYSIHEGELIEGRFRVVEISERVVEVIDKDLNIKHALPFVAGGAAGMGRAPGSIQPPPPPSEDGDEEP